jgi:hypothetical protein
VELPFPPNDPSHYEIRLPALSEVENCRWQDEDENEADEEEEDEEEDWDDDHTTYGVADDVRDMAQRSDSEDGEPGTSGPRAGEHRRLDIASCQVLAKQSVDRATGSKTINTTAEIGRAGIKGDTPFGNSWTKWRKLSPLADSRPADKSKSELLPFPTRNSFDAKCK